MISATKRGTFFLRKVTNMYGFHVKKERFYLRNISIEW